MEVNEFYTKVKPALETLAPAHVVATSRQRWRLPIGSMLFTIVRIGMTIRSSAPILFVVPQLALAFLELAVLRMALWARREPLTGLHRRAAELADQFSRQYPLWPYMTVAKSLELAFLEQALGPLLDGQPRIVEIAIGEGTFSRRVFPPDSNVVGLDIHPISLRKAVDLPHVKQAVVCDCLRPPVAPGAFDVLVANNFLHHVTDKRGTLSRWSERVRTLVFNECTPSWSLGLPIPWLMSRLGLRRAAEVSAAFVNHLCAQDLQPKPALMELVGESARIDRCESYFSERTYALATTFCFVALNIGTIPEEMKRILLHPWWRGPILRLTTQLTTLLLRFDQQQDRSRDVFISFVATARATAASGAGGTLSCPSCDRGTLDAAHVCGACGTVYHVRDGMLFLLPASLSQIEDSYDPTAAAAFPGEHL